MDSNIFAEPRMMPHVGQLNENKKIQNGNFTSTGGYENELDGSPATYLNVDHYLWHGRANTSINVAGYINAYDPTDDESALYPTSAWDACPVTTASTHFVADGMVSTKIATPLRRMRVI